VKAGGRDAPRWPSPAALLLAILIHGPAPERLAAQAVAAGRVVRPETADSIPVPGVRVVLHRVGQLEQGPVDSTTAGPGGAFRFSFHADSGAVYLLSARYRDIEYFSTPVHTNAARPDTAIRLVVYDTSGRTPVTLAARHLVVPRPGEDGSREILDLVVLSNTGSLTRVAPDSLGTSWVGLLPAGSEGLEVGESDVSPDAVVRRGDSLLVSGPIAPGEKQLVVQYHLPPGGRELRLPVEPGARVNVLVEEAGTRVIGPVAVADSQEIQGRSFRRWSGVPRAAGTVTITLPSPPGAGQGWLAPLVGVVALGLGLASWWALRRRVPVVSPPPARLDPSALLEALAALDARYAGREPEIPADEWSTYLERRARLKAELAAALAGR
jgi:hypothetical protein